MQLTNKTTFPNAIISWLAPVISQFSIFRSDEKMIVEDCYVTAVGGDTSYAVLKRGNSTYVLITTDHPDPLPNRREFEKLSGKYSLTHIITPNNKIVNLTEAEIYDTIDDFFLKIGAEYYYCAKAVQV